MNTTLQPDICIIGGGISGLWLLRKLRAAGYQCLLVEADSLGHSQTIASQGIIHGGLKYALAGQPAGVAQSLKDMPAYWRQCLQGSGDINLTDVEVLAEHFHLIASQKMGAELTSYIAAKLFAGDVGVTSSADLPGLAIGDRVYKLSDFVIDMPSLLKVLADPVRDFIIRATATVLPDGVVQLSNGTSIYASKNIFCAGAGNEALLKDSGNDHIKMQRRGLQQVMVTGPLPKVYAHLVAPLNDKPVVTITSHQINQQQICWYLGGDIAETGNNLPADQQIARARTLLTQLLPDQDISQLHFQTLQIDRAEPLHHQGRPDALFCEEIANGLVCWPVKLTLVPLLARLVETKIHGIKPVEGSLEHIATTDQPPFANLPWQSDV